MDPDPYLFFFNQILCSVVSGQELSLVTPPIESIVALIVAALILCVSAFVSGSETAFFSVTTSDLDDIDDEKREKIEKVISKPEQLLATILITNNLVNIGIVILCNFAMDKIFVFPSEMTDFLFKSVILTFILLLFGEILPKIYSNQHSVKWATTTVGGVMLISKIFAPLAKLMAASTSIVNKVVTKKADDISLDDLSNALNITEVEEGKEKTMLKEILKFGGKSVSEIMTPRVDVTDIDTDASFAELLKLIRETSYSRIPVYEKNQDNIKGVIYAKDVLPYLDRGTDFDWLPLMRAPLFTPETRMIDDILEDFRKKNIHMAIVVDEYGCTQGIVTLEDVLEEIVGEINDEHDDDEKYFTRLSADTYLFQGRTPLNDFYRITNLEDDAFKEVEEDADTIAGLILNIKQDFPIVNEVLEFGSCRFVVVKVERHRIESVKVTVLEKQDGKEAAK